MTENQDTYEIPHRSNSSRQPKMLSMRSKYGAQGYGLYWMIVEILRSEKNYSLTIDKHLWNALSMQLFVDKDTIQAFTEDCINEFELFQSDEERSVFWCDEVKAAIEADIKSKAETSEKKSKAARARWDKKTQKEPETPNNVTPIHSGAVRDR